MATAVIEQDNWHVLFFCRSSMWVWEEEHCHDCVGVRMPMYHLEVNHPAPSSSCSSAATVTSPTSTISSRAAEAAAAAAALGVEPRRTVARVASSTVRSLSEGSTSRRGSSVGVEPAESTKHVELWFCTSDLFVYNFEHCWHCERFLVHHEKEGAANPTSSSSSSLVSAADGLKSPLADLNGPVAVFGERGNDSQFLASIFAKGVRLPFQSIPVVDIGALVEDLQDDHPRVKEAVSNIAHATRNIGFMYVKNHSVDPSLLEAVFRLSRKFFAQPLEQKSRIAIANSRCHRGYFPIGGEALSTNGDLKEGLDIGQELALDDPDVQIGLPLHGPNQWPFKFLSGDEGDGASAEEIEQEFKDVMLQYMQSARRLALCILRGFALALGLPATFFAERCQKPMAALRLLHYPPQEPKELTANNVGCGAHTDYGCITVLAQDDVGGLQVWSGEKWVAAPPIENTFVINTGDMTGMWTNELFRPTVHRVINISGKERYSIPFFFNPDYRTQVSCLPQCLTEGASPLYQPVLCGDHLNKRFDDSFAYRAKAHPAN